MEIVEIGKRNNTLIVAVKGRFDVMWAPDFEKSIDRWISEGVLNFIVDFSETVFISSSGLRSILLIAKKLEAKGGKVLLAGPRDSVEKVFKISGFYTLIPIYQSVEAALEHS
jgi:anti-anti-sigma factor